MSTSHNPEPLDERPATAETRGGDHLADIVVPAHVDEFLGDPSAGVKRTRPAPPAADDWLPEDEDE